MMFYFRQFMSSLNIDQSSMSFEPENLPQPLLEKCAAVSVKPNAIKDLVEAMSGKGNRKSWIKFESSSYCICNLKCQFKAYMLFLRLLIFHIPDYGSLDYKTKWWYLPKIVWFPFVWFPFEFIFMQDHCDYQPQIHRILPRIHVLYVI